MCMFVYGYLEKLDLITRKHCLNVANLVKDFSLFLGLNNNDLYIGALMHDIGKLYIPKSIISKKSKLTKEEMDLIKMHPEYGIKFLENTSYKDNKIIYNCIKYHHLKYNGKESYPLSLLTGTDIPLEARIVSICDCFDAMTQNRGYNKVLSKNEAIERLISDKGTCFDPILVDEFVKFLS